MRINEIVSAEAQIELWRIVSNSVWQSLQQQQREEQRRKAYAAAKRKAKAKPKSKRTTGKPAAIQVPPLKAFKASAPQKPPAQPITQIKPASVPPASTKQSPPSQALNSAPALSSTNSPQVNPLYSVNNTVKQAKHAPQDSDVLIHDRHSKNSYQAGSVNPLRSVQ